MKMRIDQSRCKGCGLCAGACPLKIIAIDGGAINAEGYNPAACVDIDKCTGCALCAMMCPDCAIEVI